MKLMLTGILLTVLCLLINTQQWDWVENAENKVFDTASSFFKTDRPSDQIVIVDIDDVSLDAVGQWPWPRYRMAFLLEKLQSATPNVIGVDILFPEKDRTSLKNIQDSFKREFDVALKFNEIPDGMEDNDGYLAQVIHQNLVILSNYFLFDIKTVDTACNLQPVPMAQKKEAVTLLTATGILCNIPILSFAAGRTGFINNYIDDDGMLRRLPLILSYKKNTYVNFSIALYMQFLGISTLETTSDMHGQYVDFGEVKAPIDDKGYSLLNYRGKGKSYLYVSAVDVLNGKVDVVAFKDKFVLIGTTATGLNDFFHIAGDPYYPGVEVHATFLDNLMNNDLYMKPKWSQVFEYGMILFCGLLMSLIVVYRSSGVTFLGVFVMSGAIASLYYLFVGMHFVVPLLLPFILVIVIFVVLSLMEYRLQEKQTLIWVQTIADAQSTTIISMAAVAESRDPETGHHLLRTQRYIKLLAETLVEKGVYLDTLTAEYMDLLWESAPLHDIGKVGVPDQILLKPSRLEEIEFFEMKKHASYGWDIIESTKARSQNCGYLEMAQEIAYGHHEKWDGSGYPQGLKGEEIPISARLMALVDVYDALISLRVYKPALPYEEAEGLITEASGTHFDPVIVDAFLDVKDKFKKIGETYKDQ